MNKHWLWLLLILFWPVPAFAQYFYIETEHDWSVMTREGAWGVRQIVVQPGEMRRTTIHLGPRVYCTRLRAAEIAALALGPMVLAAAVAMSRWRRKTSPERNS